MLSLSSYRCKGSRSALRVLICALLASGALMSPPVYAQTADQPETEAPQSETPKPDSLAPNEIDPDTLPALPALPPMIDPNEGPSDEFLEAFPDVFSDVFPKLSPQPNDEGGQADTEQQADADAAATEEPRADIVIHSAKDRSEQLDKLFEQLAGLEDSDKANLMAEEIWAIWLQSGSASVDYLLLRGADAQTRGDNKLAQRMFEHVLRIAPDYAEGWTRSGRLALEQGKLGQALADTTQSLILEPRQFYSLWTLGNIFERLDQKTEAFEAYSEALKLYPALQTVKDRIEYLSDDVEGDSL